MEPPEVLVSRIQRLLADYEHDTTLTDETNIAGRVAARDDLECEIIAQIDALLAAPIPATAFLLHLRARAVQLHQQLAAIDAALFTRLRAELRAGKHRGAAFITLLATYNASTDESDNVGYDAQDLFVNQLLLHRPAPEDSYRLEADMVPYHQTPVRVILELAARAMLTDHDRFYDLGSGLGHVPILLHLLTGQPASGVEIDPALCAYAATTAAELHLPNVDFINIDARTAAYDGGTVFFLYTPFGGAILDAVLARLRATAAARPSRVFAYGPCTATLTKQPWLVPVGALVSAPDQLAAFYTAS